MSINPQVATIVRPPKEVFSKDSLALQEAEEMAVTGNLFEKIEYPDEGGQLVHYYDHPYPCKGNPYPEAVAAINTPKKLFKSTTSFLKSHLIVSGTILLLPNFILKRFVRSFMKFYVRDFVYDVMRPHFLADNRYTPMVREIRRAGYKVINTLEGEWKEYGRMTIDLLGGILEYDNAWRYRVQDILAEVNKEVFEQSPIKEIKRLGIMELDRERRSISSPTKRFAQMTSAVSIVMFLNPKFKNIIKDFIAELDLSKIALDEADDYYCLLRPDYDTHGIPFEHRQRKAIAIITKYRNDNPNRAAEAQQSIGIKTQILDGMKEMVMKEQGFPLVLFFAVQESEADETGKKKVTVKQMETVTLKENPILRTLCREALGKEPEKKNDK